MKENVQRLREVAAKARAAPPSPPEEPAFKMPRFRAVPSRVLEAAEQASHSARMHHDFLRRGAGTLAGDAAASAGPAAGAGAAAAHSDEGTSPRTRKPRVPTAAECAAATAGASGVRAARGRDRVRVRS
jgi:hypothetical protein